MWRVLTVASWTRCCLIIRYQPNLGKYSSNFCNYVVRLSEGGYHKVRGGCGGREGSAGFHRLFAIFGQSLPGKSALVKG